MSLPWGLLWLHGGSEGTDLRAPWVLIHVVLPRAKVFLSWPNRGVEPSPMNRFYATCSFMSIMSVYYYGKTNQCMSCLCFVYLSLLLFRFCLSLALCTEFLASNYYFMSITSLVEIERGRVPRSRSFSLIGQKSLSLLI